MLVAGMRMGQQQAQQQAAAQQQQQAAVDQAKQQGAAEAMAAAPASAGTDVTAQIQKLSDPPQIGCIIR